jgi:hypothetical protein
MSILTEKGATMRNRAILSLFLGLLAIIAVGCAKTVYVQDAPPPPESEVRPAAPAADAVWIDGSWAWNGHKYVWSRGYWNAKPKGHWVAGHWAKRGRGHVWVAGHWKR